MAMVEAIGRAMPEGRVVHADLVNLEVYAIYRALTELFGERAREVVWRSGEIAFEELRRQLDITETEPLPLIRRIADWLAAVGYVDAVEVRQPEQDRLDSEMSPSVVRPAALKLKALGAVLPHWYCALSAAALRQNCRLQVEMEDAGQGTAFPTLGRERWRLMPIEDQR